MADGFLDRLIIKVLRVPLEPEPPAGNADSLRVFNAARGFYNYRRIQWLIRQAGTLAGVIAGLIFLDRIISGDPWYIQLVMKSVEVIGIGTFIIQLPITYLMLRLDYRYRWYMVTDTTLRIREGLVRVREQTMTYANIQNLSIRQGPVQRFFGIADLRVRTAGGGESGGSDNEKSEAANMHLGYFRGVDNAAEIRDLIMDRMRGLKDSGLGDPDEPHVAAMADPHEVLAAARELLTETKRLRASF
jgi:membrane protein YdbS with pleckstrin-like domain